MLELHILNAHVINTKTRCNWLYMKQIQNIQKDKSNFMLYFLYFDLESISTDSRNSYGY